MKHTKAIRFFVGVFLLIIGVYYGINKYSRVDIPIVNTLGPIIMVSSENIAAGVNISVHVNGDGIIQLAFEGSNNLEETTRIWIFIYDSFFPFEWSVQECNDAIWIPYSVYEEYGGKDRSELESRYSYYDSDQIIDYPDEHHYHAVIFDDKSGKSIRFKDSQGYGVLMTADIEPEKSGYGIQLRTDEENAVYRDGSTVAIRMPIVYSQRQELIYDLNVEDTIDELKKRNYLALQLFTNGMVDGNALFSPQLNITGSFDDFEYYPSENYIIDRVEPDPYMLKPGIMWGGETFQFIPTLIFKDLREERSKYIGDVLSGILIAISGIMIINAVTVWVKDGEKGNFMAGGRRQRGKSQKTKQIQTEGNTKAADKDKSASEGVTNASSDLQRRIIVDNSEIKDAVKIAKQEAETADGNRSSEIRFNFLNAAIIDISGYIKHSDNKVYIILAAHGVILAGMVSALDVLLSYYRQISTHCQNIAIWITMGIFIICTVTFYLSAVWTLLSRKGKAKGTAGFADENNTTEEGSDGGTTNSFWFISKNKDEYPFSQYWKDFYESTDESLVENMALELYKLNEINIVKMKYANKTIRWFFRSLIVAGIFIAELVAFS